MTVNDPSINPADEDSLAGTMQFVFKKLMQSGVNGMLPAQVIQYDPIAARVQVQILIKIVGTGGEAIDRQQIASIPVLQIGGGGFLLNMPIKSGDLGWICAADRDISNFLATYANARPPTQRMFSFSDGLFVPHAMTGVSIADPNVLTLQTSDGTTSVAIAGDRITLTVGAITLDVTAAGVATSAPLAANGGITVTNPVAGKSIDITGDFNLTGNMMVVGNIMATGTITPDPGS